MRKFVPICLLLVASAARAEDASPKITADVVYGRKDGMALTFDVITPAKPNGGRHFWLQSGGWYSHWTDPRGMAAACKPFLDKGYTMFIVRHGTCAEVRRPRRRRRRAPQRALHPRQGERLRRRCQPPRRDGRDARRPSVAGAGHDRRRRRQEFQGSRAATERPRRLRRALCPPTDISTWVDNPPAEIKKHAGLKPPLTFDKKLAPELSPALKATEKAAPSLMIHGDKDKLVPIEHSTKMVEVLEKLKVPCKLATIKGATTSSPRSKTRNNRCRPCWNGLTRTWPRRSTPRSRRRLRSALRSSASQAAVVRLERPLLRCCAARPAPPAAAGPGRGN